MKISIRNFEFRKCDRKTKVSFDCGATHKGYKISSIRDRTATLDSLTAVDDTLPLQNLKIDGKNRQNQAKSMRSANKMSHSLEKAASQLIHANTLRSAQERYRRSVSVLKTQRIRSKTIRANYQNTSQEQSHEKSSQNAHRNIQKILKSYLKVQKNESIKSAPMQTKNKERKQMRVNVRIKKRAPKKDIDESSRKFSVYGPWEIEDNEQLSSFF